MLSAAYGTMPAGAAEGRRQAWGRVARWFLACWGDREVRLSRAPARIALNPHCEHRGAWFPYMTHSRGVICLAGVRSDDSVTLTSLDPSHASPLSFGLHSEVALASAAWPRGWLGYIEDAETARRREARADPKERRSGRTGSLNFVRAAALRLPMEARRPPVEADLAIEGDIPVGVGQSSFSALVEVSAPAPNRLWGLGPEPECLTSLAREAEWYVGTREGAGDHAAMLLGSADGLAGLRFVPSVTVREARPMALPPGYQILIVNSSHKAIKNSEERRLFSAGIFAYRFALLYLREAVAVRRQNPGLSVDPEEIRFLADVNMGRFPLSTIYQLLLAVPETVSSRELLVRYPGSYEPSAQGCFRTADCDQLPGRIPIRGAAVCGLGRVDRGLAMHELCARGDEGALREFGRLVYVTHDGDRVSRYGLREQRHSLYSGNRKSVSDARLGGLLEASCNGVHGADLTACQLRRQSGFYGASIPELDRTVDVVSSLPEVLGAGLMGAGGGGCVLTPARDGAGVQERVTSALTQHCYEPLGKAADVGRWVPAAPAGMLLVEEQTRPATEVWTPEALRPASRAEAA